MNIPRPPSRIGGRALAGSLLLATFAATALAAGPAAEASLRSPSQPGQPASAAAPAPAPGQVTWSVIPATANGPDRRNTFSYSNVKPGSTITDHVAVINRSHQAAAFAIYATDATGTTASNALTLLPANKKPVDTGAWTTFSRHGAHLSVIIPGGNGVIETFTIAVPHNATPGDHTGGMIASVGVPHKNSAGQMVTLDQRIAVPIEFRVTGPLHAALQVQSVSTSFNVLGNPFGSSSAKISYTVQNTGNVRLTGSQLVKVTGPFGMSSAIRPQHLPTLLPGDSLRVTAAAPGLYPAGPMTAHVTVTPGWPATATPLSMRVPLATRAASLFALPWSLVGLILLLAAGGFGTWWYRRRRRRQHEAEVVAAAEHARRETERRLLGKSAGSEPE